MCGNEPCRHENADAIKSFVTQTRALVAMTTERDEARAQVARVRALHTILLKGIRFVTLDDIRAALEPTDLPKGMKP